MNLLKTRKGITPVIAIVLLLMMTVAASGLAYTWVISVQKQTQEGLTTQITQIQQQTQAQLSIDTVYKGASDNIEFILRNSGTYTYTSDDMSNINFYVDGKEAEGTPTCATLTSPGTTCRVTTTDTFPTETGADNAVIIKVVSPIGSGVTHTCSISKTTQTYC